MLKAKAHRQKRMDKYLEKIKKAREVGYGVPLSAFSKNCFGSSWADPNSPTGYTQVCCYKAYGTCQSPCNGDC